MKRTRSAAALTVATLAGLAAAETTFDVPLMPGADHPAQQGFVRITALDHDVEVTIDAWDRNGLYRATTLDVAARTSQHFNSEDLEIGAPHKGIYDGIGPGVGDWYLRLRAESPFVATSYVRTPQDGFLTAMGNVLVPQQPLEGFGAFACMFEAALFNPGKNVNQVSSMRIVERDGVQASVAIYGLDDAGMIAGPATVRVRPFGALTLTAQQLEAGDPDIDGRLGVGEGKWRLLILTDGAIVAMNLMETPTGHITNLGPMLVPVESDREAAEQPDAACPRGPGTFVVARPR